MSIFRSIVLVLLLVFPGFFVGAQSLPDSLTGPGVPYPLALYREKIVRDIQYELAFHVPVRKEQPVTGEETIRFILDPGHYTGKDLPVDFKGDAKAIGDVRVNGQDYAGALINEHLILPARLLRTGINTVQLRFIAGNGALNRNNDFLYTLLVPDRARTLFPCFDEPGLKAVYTLSLTIPEGWKALANAPLRDSIRQGDSVLLHFGVSDKISTYLFSWAAGRFEEIVGKADDRPVHFLYRETDSTKLRLSMDSIFRIEDQSLRFLEDYTNIRYPFRKFDFVAIPDFQFGGMEHVGAIQYKSSSLFLDSGATRDQLNSRSNLLAHETAHMWFGDWVTMSWFNDVWMKEVFANFMADKITGYNDDLKFLTDHYPLAYAVDRTAGTHPIRQQLDNLQDAGSLYGNIIYQKAPIVMRQLEALMGVDAFRDGLRGYLRLFGGGNAAWPDLIRMLQEHTAIDLGAWNKVWINGAGRPKFSYTLKLEAGRIKDFVIREKAEDGSARFWPQVFRIAMVYPDSVVELPVNMNTGVVRLSAALGKAAPKAIVFNSSGIGYGVFPADERVMSWVASGTPAQQEASVASGGAGAAPLVRASIYINLYENMLNGGVVTPRQLLAFDRSLLAREPEELALNLLLDQVNSIFWRCLPTAVRDSIAPGLEKDCWEAMEKVAGANEKKLLFRAYTNIVLSRKGQDRLYEIWKSKQAPSGVRLSEDDYTGLAAALALRTYPDSRGILEEQVTRIQNPDRKLRLQYLLPSLSADVNVRDSFFFSLKTAPARRKEALVVSAVGYLQHPLRQQTSEKYLAASLDWLADIQRTGDVFFPLNWLQASFGWYKSASAAALVRKFLAANPGYNPKLRAKILQATDNLMRAQMLCK